MKYSYLCPHCNKELETDTRTLPQCPKCGKTMRRIWNVPAVQYKGSGWAGKPSDKMAHEENDE